MTNVLIQEWLERAALIAEAIDSGRGNEKEIAKAIRELAKRGYWVGPSMPPAARETEATEPSSQPRKAPGPGVTRPASNIPEK